MNNEFKNVLNKEIKIKNEDSLFLEIGINAKNRSGIAEITIPNGNGITIEKIPFIFSNET